MLTKKAPNSNLIWRHAFERIRTKPGTQCLHSHPSVIIAKL